jgi:hypothetical protein
MDLVKRVGKELEGGPNAKLEFGPEVRLGKFNMAITGVLTIPRGGNKKGT